MTKKLKRIMIDNRNANFFLDEAFGISSKFVGNLIKFLSATSYCWIAFQNQECPNLEDIKGTL